jgi:pyruvate ferredoxin oxidoreductase beta subunit
MEGLDEMKDSEQIGGRFVQRQYVTDEAQVVIDRLKADKKERKKAARDYAKSINFKNAKKVVA